MSLKTAFLVGIVELASLQIICTPSTISAQEGFSTGFETYACPTTGDALTGRDGFSTGRDNSADFKVYSYIGNSLGFAQNPTGGNCFVAGNMTNLKPARARHAVSFGSGGIWKVSYDFAGLSVDSNVAGLPLPSAHPRELEALGTFMLTTANPGSDELSNGLLGLAYFKNFFTWDKQRTESPYMGYFDPGPINLLYEGYDDASMQFGFFGATPGMQWEKLSLNHWYRVSTTVDFDTNGVLEVRIKDLTTGAESPYSPSNVYLFGGRHDRCSSRIQATTLGPEECFPIPTAFSLFVGLDPGNVVAFDNIDIRRNSSPVGRGIVYDNGPNLDNGGTSISNYIAAADFHSDFDVDITGASVSANDGPEDQNKRWDGTVEWWILEDNLGNPGQVVAAGTGQRIKQTKIKEDSLGYRNYGVDFEFGTPVHISAGQVYWLALHMQTGYERISVWWENTAPFTSGGFGPNILRSDVSRGELVDGFPDFTSGFPTRYEKSFRITLKVKPGYGPIQEIDQPIQLSDYTQIIKYICKYSQAPTFCHHVAPEQWHPSDSHWQISDIYQLISRLLARDENFVALKDNLRLAFERAPIGDRYTASLRETALKTVTTMKNSQTADDQLFGQLLEAVNALDLDVHTPKCLPQEVGPERFTSVAFQNNVWVAFSGISYPGQLRLKILDKVPAIKHGYLPVWPVSSYVFEFSGGLSEWGYADVNIDLKGISIPEVSRDLRIFEWDGKQYADITTHVDVDRKLITGRTNSLSTVVLMMPLLRSSYSQGGHAVRRISPD